MTFIVSHRVHFLERKIKIFRFPNDGACEKVFARRHLECFFLSFMTYSYVVVVAARSRGLFFLFRPLPSSGKMKTFHFVSFGSSCGVRTAVETDKNVKRIDSLPENVRDGAKIEIVTKPADVRRRWPNQPTLSNVFHPTTFVSGKLSTFMFFGRVSFSKCVRFRRDAVSISFVDRKKFLFDNP